MTEQIPPQRLLAPYRSATYALSVHERRDLPADEGREVAFAGRSNAGKSSAINALTGQRALARASRTPGRTRQIIFFRLDDHRRLVDLPGYGYASVPDTLRRHWRALLEHYLSVRASLRGIVLVMDARHPLMPFDRQMLDWCRAHHRPLHVLLTRADKLKRGPALAALRTVRAALGPDASAQLFSAPRREGVAALAQRLAPWFGYPGPAVAASPNV